MRRFLAINPAPFCVDTGRGTFAEFLLCTIDPTLETRPLLDLDHIIVNH